MQTTTFAERYQNGDYVAVWDELVSLGAGVRHELYYEDAVAVATETMRRVRHNIELLIPRLATAGYRFIPPGDEYVPDIEGSIDANVQRMMQQPMQPNVPGLDMQAYMEKAAAKAKERLAPMLAEMEERRKKKRAEVAKMLKIPPMENPKVFDPPSGKTEGQLKKIEKAAGGPLPISLRAWYEQVGGVSLMGSHPVFNTNQDPLADPLVVCPLGELLQMMDMFGDECDEGVALWLSPDDLHKANISGGDPYIITVPNAGADAPFENECHETTFVNYLREAFHWGGFPGLKHSSNPPLQQIEELTAGFLPF